MEYVFQGFDYSRSGAVLQPQIDLDYGNVSGSAWFDLAPTLDAHWDVDAGRGWYATFGLATEIPTPLPIALGARSFATWDKGDFAGAAAVPDSWVMALEVAWTP